MHGMKHIVYLTLALGMVLYAAPQLQLGQGWTLPTIFGAFWIGFALLFVAAQLHQILWISDEEKRELKRIKTLRRWQAEQWILGRKKRLRSKNI